MASPSKSWKPSAEVRKQVETLAGYGLTNGQIGGVFGQSEATIAYYCAKEITDGKAKAIAKLAQHVYARAFKNDTMAMFWMKTQARWREVDRMEITGVDAGPVQLTVIIKDKHATTT
mgnify:CR=1 FL=1